MKKLFLPVLALIVFSGCGKDMVDMSDQLVLEIATSHNKVNIEPADLPGGILDEVEYEYFETYIEAAAHVSGKGYELTLGNEDMLYFRENGMRIRSHESMRRHGPCGRGIIVRPENLPDAITQYVTDNYPDAGILRAKRFVRGYVVLISGRRLLIFDSAYDFVKETAVFHFCKDIVVTDVATLPDAVTDYIDQNYPDAEVIKAGIIHNKLVVGILTPDGRKILVFDRDGNFLFVRG